MQPNQTNRDRPEKSNQSPGGLPPQDWRRWIWPGLLLMFLLLLIFNSGSFGDANSSRAPEIVYSSVRNNIERIAAITFESSEMQATGVFQEPIVAELVRGGTERIDRFTVILTRSQAETIQNLLDTNNPDADVRTNEPPSLPLIVEALLGFLPFLLIFGFFVWMMRRAQGQVNGVFSFGRSQAREYDAQTPRVTFDDVAGQDSAKRELVEIVDFLKEPEKYISLGARIPRGVLLVGPPGTGKTLMARAVAGEANVAFYSIAASEFVEMFVGVGASRVRDLFKRAKDNSPSIVFIDEIDAVGRQRGAGLGGGNDEREQTLNQLLAELDGFDQSSTVIVMAATNRPDVLDPALLRPGRFDRQVTVDLPDRAGRLSILKIHSRGKPLARDVDLDSIAGATIGFSGADLSNLANEAALTAARKNHKKIAQEDFTFAFERIILGTERPPLSNPEERRVVAYHEAGHALTALLIPGADQVLKVTITPRGQALGVTAFMPEDDRRNYPRRYLDARIRVGLGGRVAEELTFGEVTTGAGGDIRMITQIARRMVTQFGMSPLGNVDYSNGGDQPFLGYSLSQGRQYSEETAAKVDAEVRRIIDEAHEHVTVLLNEQRDKLDTIANELMQKEVIEREYLLDLMGLSHNKPLDTPEETLHESAHVVESEEVDPFSLYTDPEQDSPTQPENAPSRHRKPPQDQSGESA
jgi:cell division protease FtsH